MSRLNPWWMRYAVDATLLVLIGLCVVGLTILAAILATRAYSAACLTITVPPQAVVAQPDGDTFHVFAFQPGGLVKIRVEGVNTPERHEPGWQEAKTFTKQWLAQGPFTVQTCGKPTLDRIVGRVERDGATLAEALIAAGWGR